MPRFEGPVSTCEPEIEGSRPIMRESPHQYALQEVERAKLLYLELGRGILCDPESALLLARYREAIRKTSGLMRTSGVVSACTECAVRGPGSCCFKGIEENCDRVLLLLNLLLGCNVPETAEMSEECFFSSGEGCRLIAKSSFCLNYLCPGLHEFLDSKAKESLLRTVGDELAAGWELEMAVRRRISS